MCRASLPGRGHPRCVRDAPAPRCASMGEGDTCRVQRASRPVPGQSPPQDWRCRCRRATIASPSCPQGSPAGTACAPLACSKEIVMRGCYDTRPPYLCQQHFHLPPRLLLDARGIIGQAWRDGWFVQAFPQHRDRWGFCGQSLFLSRTYVLHRQGQTPASTRSLHGGSGGRLRCAVCSDSRDPFRKAPS
jgi:hypothetical protein